MFFCFFGGAPVVGPGIVVSEPATPPAAGPVGGAEKVTPAAPVGEKVTPTAPFAGAEPAKKKRGRPPGKKDTAPRKRKHEGVVDV